MAPKAASTKSERRKRKTCWFDGLAFAPFAFRRDGRFAAIG
jgi:hypothetical protein